MRGQQSAALVVSTAADGSGSAIRLHVEDHPQPLVELRRLVQVHARTRSSTRHSSGCRPASSTDLSPLEHALELAPDVTEIRFRPAAA